jgi:hypothetical protein
MDMMPDERRSEIAVILAAEFLQLSPAARKSLHSVTNCCSAAGTGLHGAHRHG